MYTYLRIAGVIVGVVARVGAVGVEVVTAEVGNEVDYLGRHLSHWSCHCRCWSPSLNPAPAGEGAPSRKFGIASSSSPAGDSD